jgi:type II secretory pathway component PulC
MTHKSTTFAGLLAFLISTLVFVSPPRAAATQFSRSSCAYEAPAKPATAAKTLADPYAREVTRIGSRVVVSRGLADATKQNNRIILSKVAVKSRLDREGKLRAYELVQVDKGSVVQKMGFLPGDQLVSVNGIPVRDLDEKGEDLKTADRFEVSVLRKGKIRKVMVEIR